MPRSERTAQGEQYLIPGAERRTAPGLPYAAEPDGQLALHFYEPPDAAGRHRSRGGGPARPTRGAGLGAGLFGAGLAYFPQLFAARLAGDGPVEGEGPP